jgi:hypothetical protein
MAAVTPVFLLFTISRVLTREIIYLSSSMLMVLETFYTGEDGIFYKLGTVIYLIFTPRIS